jgi:hypothetical protein
VARWSSLDAVFGVVFLHLKRKTLSPPINFFYGRYSTKSTEPERYQVQEGFSSSIKDNRSIARMKLSSCHGHLSAIHLQCIEDIPSLLMTMFQREGSQTPQLEIAARKLWNAGVLISYRSYEFEI